MENSQKNLCNLHQMEFPFNFGSSALMAFSGLPLISDSVQPWNQSFFTGGHGGTEEEVVRNIAGDPLRVAGDGFSGDVGNGGQTFYGRIPNSSMDPRKLRRIISNRVSAQKSRLKKVQYVADMERKMKALEAHIAILTPQVEMYKNQQRLLQMEQMSLNQKIFTFSRNKLLKDAEIEENRMEVNKLRELHLKLQQHNNNEEITVDWETAFEQLMHHSEFGTNSMVSLPPNQDNAAMTAEGNGLGRFKSTAQHRKVEYKWMPTPGLRRVSEPTSNWLGRYETPRPN